ncbi:alpha/beta hydrolase [Hyphococcus sp.]|jgi:pimeloyl-ACP methyl ester carboxylesterase|uniref:alpha/beta hydrolase n=1 Tax=Hyphococcus sp. TaxID=2038636 RepID=UPI003D0CD7F3
MKTNMSRRLLLAAAAIMAAPACVSAQEQEIVDHAAGVLDSGAEWAAAVPSDWNGVLLLWSHGYNPTLRAAEYAPSSVADALLAKGYALAGSSYASGGWALEDAVPDQAATIDAFSEKFSAPETVIGWGMSMGGLVTTALAEDEESGLDGGLSLCSSMGGAVGMMNMALDGAYAFKILVAPQSDIHLVDVDDDLENLRRVQAVLASARETREGRARVALAAVLAGLPGWTDAKSPKPADDDIWAQEEQMAHALPMGVFLPRTDQEKRAGGVFSWNDSVDYAAQLDRTGRREFIEALYAEAGLELESDLKRLNEGERITAQAEHVQYMLDNYTPTAAPRVPLLAVQRVGDGMTSPALQGVYADAAQANSGEDMVKSLWIDAPGHCNFTPDELLISIAMIAERIQTGAWPEPDEKTFTDYQPMPMQRPCFRGGACEGLPE